MVAAAMAVAGGGCAVWQSQDVHGRTGEVAEPVSQCNYYIYLPNGYNTNRKYPLVVSIHGMKPFDNAFPQLETWRKICDENNWIAIAPQLKSPDMLNQFPFHKVDSAIIDDETEIVSSVQDTCRRYSVDARYIMMTGWSSGGYLIHYTAARHPELFTMIAPQGANFSEDIMPQYITEAAREMPVYIYHGALDLPMVISDTNAAMRWYARHGYKNVKMDEAPGGHERHPELAAKYFLNLMHSDTNGAVAARTLGGAGAATWLGATSPIVAAKLMAGPPGPATLASGNSAGLTGLASAPVATPVAELGGSPVATSGLVARSTGDLPTRLTNTPTASGAPAGIPSAGTTGSTSPAVWSRNGSTTSTTPPVGSPENPVAVSPRPTVPASPVVSPPPPGRVTNLPTPSNVVVGPVASKTNSPAPIIPETPAAGTMVAANPGPAAGAVIAPSGGNNNPYSWERIGPSKPADSSKFGPTSSAGAVIGPQTPPVENASLIPPRVVGAGVTSGSPADSTPLAPPATAAPVVVRTDSGSAKVSPAPVNNTGVVNGSVAPLGSLPAASVSLPVNPASAQINPGGKYVPARADQSLNDPSRFAAAPVSADPVVPTLAVAAPRPMTPSGMAPAGKTVDPAADRVNPAARMIPIPPTMLTPASAAGPQGVPAASNLLSVRILPSVQEGGAPLTVEFRAEIRGVNSPIVRYRWRLDDSLFSTSHFGVLTFQQAGQYPVELTVTDAAGNTYRGKTTIRVAG